MIVSNSVRYYKTAQEAIAAANPSMRNFLCPTPGAKDAAAALVKRLGELKGQEFVPEKYATLSEMFAGAKELFVNQGEELELLKSLEKCIKSMAKGELGEAIFKLKLKRDKELAEVLRGVGFQA